MVQNKATSSINFSSLADYSIDAVKDYLRVDYNTDDNLIKRLSDAAEKACSSYCGTSFVLTFFEAYTDTLEDSMIHLPVNGQSVSVGSVHSIDQEGNETALVLGTDYFIRGLTDISIRIATQSFTLSGASVSYKVSYTVSWGTSISQFPANVVEAIYKTTKDLYDNRGNADSGEGRAITMLPTNAKSLLARYRQKLFM